MTYEKILDEMKAYVERELLDGQGADLTATTPLLEWGVLTSLRVVRLLQFIRERFGLEIPPDQLSATNLQNLDSITKTLLGLDGARSGDTNE